MLKSLKKMLGMKEESSDITLVAEVVLGRKDEPARLASSAGVTWSSSLQEEWNQRFSRCSSCHVWIRGKRSVWCDVCKIRGI